MTLAKKAVIGAIIVAIIIGIVSAFAYLSSGESSDTIEVELNDETAITENPISEEPTQGKEYTIELREDIALGES